MCAALIWRHRLLLPDLYAAWAMCHVGGASCLVRSHFESFVLGICRSLCNRSWQAVTKQECDSLRSSSAQRSDTTARFVTVTLIRALSTCCFKFNLGVTFCFDRQQKAIMPLS